MIKLILTTLLSLILTMTVLGQDKVPMSCGTHTTEADIKLLLQNKEFSKSLNLRSMETVWIPVQFHLIAKSDGNGRIQINRVFEALCKLNEDFSSSSMQFYFNGDIKEINNSAMYDMNFPPIPSGVNTQFAIRRVQGNVNIFVGNGLASGNSGLPLLWPTSYIFWLGRHYL